MTAPLYRRTVLRGLGTAVALPILEAMGSARSRTIPLRLVYVYVPNGVVPAHWTPAQEGALPGELPSILEPLAPFRARFAVHSGLTHDKGRANGDGPGDHARAAATFLTGVQPLKSDGRVGLGISADQIAARELGGRTRLRSLELGCEGGRASGQCDSGYACAYSNNLSWTSATTPAPKEVDPRLVFDRLFRGGGEAGGVDAAERRARRRSVLDFVREDARRLHGLLGSADRARLEQYLDGIRELERRLELAAAPRVDAVPDAARPAERSAELGERARQLSDLLVLALATDTTRIATFLVANEGSNRGYADQGAPEGHHELSHHGGDADKLEKLRRISRFHVELLAHLVAGLAAAREAGHDLLASTMLVYGSGLRDGNRHDHGDLPLLLAGGEAAGLRPGRHVRHPPETPMNDLHLALLERLGVRPAAFGDGRGPLADV